MREIQIKKLRWRPKNARQRGGLHEAGKISKGQGMTGVVIPSIT